MLRSRRTQKSPKKPAVRRGAVAKNSSRSRTKQLDQPLYREADHERLNEPPTRINDGEEVYRSESRRDYARLIHSPAFRRLQGKTQLFPGWESDFFRNRLTHSLEVAQVAESLAYRFNHEDSYFCEHPIDARITAFAGLAHDLGHPPFGHNGENALDDCMKQSGGFEGNAQTLRILTKLEKKSAEDQHQIDENGNDNRIGLNLSFRSIASVLKYDRKIPISRNTDKPVVKGYYASEESIVQKVKESVAPNLGKKEKFKTIECHLMDLADDIAYSTYDLEDSFKAGFLTPLTILASPPELLERVSRQIRKRTELKLDREDVMEVLYDTFTSAILPSYEDVPVDRITEAAAIKIAAEAYSQSNDAAGDGTIRVSLTSDLITFLMSGVKVSPNFEIPSMSKAYFDDDTLKRVEVLKTYTYEATIMSSRLKVAEHRGYEIVQSIFEGIVSDGGKYLMPDDFRRAYENFDDEVDKKRVICDFIAGMTDRYAIEFYARLRGENPQSIFKPF